MNYLTKVSVITVYIKVLLYRNLLKNLIETLTRKNKSAMAHNQVNECSNFKKAINKKCLFINNLQISLSEWLEIYYCPNTHWTLTNKS